MTRRPALDFLPRARAGDRRRSVCGGSYFAAAFVLAVALQGGTGRGDEVAPLGRFDYAPYAVKVSLTFAPDSTVTPAFRANVASTLTCRIRQSFGAVWNVVPEGAVRNEDWLTPPNETGLARLTYAAGAERVKEARCDKAYFLVVQRAGTHWTIAGREWDGTLQSIGPVLTAEALERRAVADAALGLLERLFSPLLIVDDADRKSQGATLTVRAGSIPFGDPQFAPLKPGAVLLPVFRFLDSKHAVKKISSVPWSYLVLDQIDRGRAYCSVVSAFRAPLAANMRRRVEAVAVLTRPELASTQLKLVAGRTVKQPLAGVFVTLEPIAAGQADSKANEPEKKGAAEKQANKKKSEPDKSSSKELHPKNSKPKISHAKDSGIVKDSGKTASAPASSRSPASESNQATAGRAAAAAHRTSLLSDRAGTVTIPVDLRHPLQRIEIHSGTAILARRPIVPGIDAEVTLELPDDTLRLGAERDIDLLRSRLIEAVARRAAFIGRTRAALKTDSAAATRLLAEMEHLPGSEEFSRELNKIRVLALDDAHRLKDKLAERRIEDLCQRTGKLIEQYLPDDRIQTFKEEIGDILHERESAAAAANKKPAGLPPLMGSRASKSGGGAKKGRPAVVKPPANPGAGETSPEPGESSNSPLDSARKRLRQRSPGL